MTVFTIDIPWALLCPDNQKQIPVPVIAKYAGQKCVSRLMTSSRYKKGKEGIEDLAMQLVSDFGIPRSRYEGDGLNTLFDRETPLSLVAMAHPPTKRKTDPINYSKMICDALQGIVYEDDNQIICNGPWILGRVDKENPRITVTIHALAKE